MYELFRPLQNLWQMALGTMLLSSSFFGCNSPDLAINSVNEPTIGDSDTKTPTLPPLANAGPDREVLRGYQTQLDATGTWSLDGAPITVAWQQTGGDSVYLSNASDAKPYFVAPLDEQTLIFQLTVSNGAFTVTDDVMVVVSNDPQRVAPVVNGGPDQVGDTLDTSAFAPVTTNDVSASTTTISYEEVTPNRTGLAPRNASGAYSGPKIYKLIGVSDGLASAPDYVLVYAYATAVKTPLATASGPTQASTGGAVALSASSSNINDNKSVTYHWEQTRGTPVLQTLDEQSPSINVDVPKVAQQLVIRVHAYDGVLASAPSEISLEVLPGDGLHPGQLVPGSDVHARTASTVALMASASGASPGVKLAWQQTRGTTVTTSVTPDGNQITFATPAASDELAFVVTSTIDDSESAPAAYRIVVNDSGNSQPAITVCVPNMITAGSTIEVTARVTDPDGDGVSITEASTSVAAGLAPVTDGTQIGTCAVAPSAAVGSSIAQVYSLTAPQAGSSLQLTVGAKDVLGASTNTTVTITP